MRKLLCVAMVAILAGCANNPNQKIDYGSAIGASLNVLKAVNVSDAQVKAIGLSAVKSMDGKSVVASPRSAYARRLARITKSFSHEAGLNLNFKVYMTPDLNAVCYPDGSVRVNSGLMDRFTDDELRFVIGHEIGHAALGHMRQKIQVSSLADAGRDLLAASGNQMAVQFSQSQIATLSQAFINAQFSQNEESQADAYGVSFLKRHHYDPHAAITAMQKLQAATGDDHSWLADHPASSMRTQHISLLVAGVPQSKIPTNNVSDILSRIGASLGGGGSTGPQVTSERASK